MSHEEGGAFANTYGKMSRGLFRIFIILVGAAGVIWFLLPFFAHRILNIGNATGILVFLCMGLYGVFFGGVNRIVRKIWAKNAGKMLLSLLALCVAAVVALTAVMTGCMVSAAVSEPVAGSTVIVLGCKVNGENASLMLAERLDAAYDYITENEDAVCILSGGQGSGENITEAECMYRYLTNKGIDENRLYKEDRSTSTRENLRFSKEIIDEQGLSTDIAVVTNEFHEYRAGKVADSLNLRHSAVSGKTALWLLPTYYVRELYGILYEWIL